MTRLKPGLVLAVIPLLAFGLYCFLYAPLPTPPGADVAYYLLGVKHLSAGHWPWGGEPPLSFALLWPFTAVLGDKLGFVVLAAALTAGTVWLCGLLASAAVARGKPAHATPGAALAVALIAQIMAFLYASPHYASCFLKNTLANALMCLGLLAWFRPAGARWPAPLAGGLAVLAHPGALVPLGAAICLYPLGDPTDLTGWLRRRRSTPRPLHSGRLLVGLGSAAAAAGLAIAVAAWPTVARYANTYFGSAQSRTSPFAGWDLATLFTRYLPLWTCLLLVSVLRLRRRSPDGMHPQLLRLLWAWTFALTGLSIVGGAVGRRLEIQQFIPLSVLAAVYVGSWRQAEEAAGRAILRRAGSRAHLALVLTVLFGLGILALSLHPRPMLKTHEVAALAAAGQALPQDSKLVTFGTDTVYWAEYLTGVPVVGPNLLPERGLVPGPTYLLSENPTRGGGTWSEQALGVLRDGGRLAMDSERFLLLRADDDAGFFARWSEDPSRVPLELLRLDPALWPVADVPDPAGVWTKAIGWLLFAPAGLLMVAGLGDALAVSVGLICSYLVWTSLARLLRRRFNAR